MKPRFALASALSSASRRLSVSLALASLVLGSTATIHAAAPYDLIPLNPASPNYNNVFNGVKINNTVPESNAFKAGDEILSAVYAYLCPNSPKFGQVAYRERLFVLLDHRLGMLAAGSNLRDISFVWQGSYAYMLMKQHRPAEISAARIAIYDTAMTKNNAAVVASADIYTHGRLASLWINGDIRLAMSAYFGGLAVGDTATANKAQYAIDNLMSVAGLQDGGTHYLGFWNEVASYHDETVKFFILWWKITGSPSIKAALDATRLYALVSNEPSGFTEQSSNIPYKHMYNTNHNKHSSLWKAYLYNDGYNYFYGAAYELATSTELVDAILYQPSRITKTPPSHVGAMWDGNIQGPRGRFNGNWGWIANGRDVQNGGPENSALIASQGYDSIQCGKNTFVGAFTLGPIANKTPLKGAVDGVLVEFKQSAGPEGTDYMRGNPKYRFLAQDEHTNTITRKNFGTLATSYRLSTRTSDTTADPNWDATVTPWIGQQLWVLTGERMIGLVQLVSNAPTSVYGLDARIVFTGGRLSIMGSELPLTQPDPTSFAFGDLRAKIQGTTFTGAITSKRIGISEGASADTYSALVRINDVAVNNDAVINCPAGTRRWIVLDFVRTGTSYATPVVNVMPENVNYAVLQFTEGTRKVRIVQNLTSAPRSYTGGFLVGSTYSQTTLHRSWSATTTPLTVVGGAATVTDTIPAYGHMIAVNSNQPDDHTNAFRTSGDVFP